MVYIYRIVFNLNLDQADQKQLSEIEINDFTSPQNKSTNSLDVETVTNIVKSASSNEELLNNDASASNESTELVGSNIDEAKVNIINNSETINTAVEPKLLFISKDQQKNDKIVKPLDKEIAAKKTDAAISSLKPNDTGIFMII